MAWLVARSVGRAAPPPGGRDRPRADGAGRAAAPRGTRRGPRADRPVQRDDRGADRDPRPRDGAPGEPPPRPADADHGHHGLLGRTGRRDGHRRGRGPGGPGDRRGGGPARAPRRRARRDGAAAERRGGPATRAHRRPGGAPARRSNGSDPASPARAWRSSSSARRRRARPISSSPPTAWRSTGCSATSSRNALAVAPRPGGHVWLDARPVAPVAAGDPGAVALSVTDDGPGFPPGATERAFERFYRGDPSRAGAGSGLGLAIVRELAEAHGGRAVAEQVAPARRAGQRRPAPGPAPARLTRSAGLRADRPARRAGRGRHRSPRVGAPAGATAPAADRGRRRRRSRSRRPRRAPRSRPPARRPRAASRPARPSGLCHSEDSVGASGGRRIRPSHSPPRSPPTCAALSIPTTPPSPKPIARLIRMIVPTWVMIARSRRSRTGWWTRDATSRTPNSPKIAPEAPTANVVRGAERRSSRPTR